MAQYFTDFADDALGTFPASWSLPNGGTVQVAERPGSTNNKALRFISGSSVFAQWNTVPAAQDVEMLARVEFNNSGTDRLGYFFARAADLTTSLRYLRAGPFNGSGASIIARRPTFSSIVTDSSIFIDLALWHFMRFVVSGNSVQFKIWPVADPEPAWLLSGTQTHITEAGRVGLLAGIANDFYVDTFAVGTNGDPAPTEPLVAARRRSPLMLTPW